MNPANSDSFFLLENGYVRPFSLKNKMRDWLEKKGCMDGTAIRFELKARREDRFNAVQMMSWIKWFNAIKIKIC